MKTLTSFLILLFCACASSAQELYPATEPASNMATGSIGLRMSSKFFKMAQDGHYSYRLMPELMVGVSRRLMVHANLYASDMYQPDLKFEGGSIYGKYRFFSSDDVHSHFRMAAFSRISLIDNPSVLKTGYTYYTTGPNGAQEEHQGTRTYVSDEIDLDGNNSGFLAGLVATRLIHKLAFSSSISYINRWDNLGAASAQGQSLQALDFSFSSGYLFLPFVYRDFKQTNFNLYCEFLGSSALDKSAFYLDIAPSVQFIFSSISRLDLSYRGQIAGDMNRLSKNSIMLRFEYNLLNTFKNRR